MRTGLARFRGKNGARPVAISAKGWSETVPTRLGALGSYGTVCCPPVQQGTCYP